MCWRTNKFGVDDDNACCAELAADGGPWKRLWDYKFRVGD